MRMCGIKWNCNSVVNLLVLRNDTLRKVVHDDDADMMSKANIVICECSERTSLINSHDVRTLISAIKSTSMELDSCSAMSLRCQ